MARGAGRDSWTGLMITTALLLAVAPALAGDEDLRAWPHAYQEGMAALGRHDLAAAVSHIEQASRLAPPNHPLVLYGQTRAYAQAGRLDDAFRSLSLLVEKGVAGDLLVSPVFDAMREDERWDEWQPRLQDLVARVEHSSIAFRLNEPDFIPDAITYDSGSRRFLVGSLHKRKIVAVDEVSGRTADYATWREAGFLGVRGLEADNVRGALYVLTAGGPRTQGYTPDLDGQSFLHRLQLSSGRQVTKLSPPRTGGGHLLNDLIQAADGRIYLTDTTAGIVYRWRPGAPALEHFVTIGAKLAPDGLAWSRDQRALYVAHIEGISRIDVRTGASMPVGHAPGMTLVGIDGLSSYRGDLIAVQNGVPGLSRVVRLRLTADGQNVDALQVLDANLPEHDVPTTGVVVGDGFYYIANSQIGRFTAEGVPGPPERLQRPAIRRVNLAAN